MFLFKIYMCFIHNNPEAEAQMSYKYSRRRTGFISFLFYAYYA